jgi:glycerate kinase
VITGEGKLDAESFNGKVVGGVLQIAGEHGVPALVIAGDVDDEVASRATAVSLLAEFGTAAAWGEPLRCIERATTAWLRREEN